MTIRHGLLALLSRGPQYGYQLRAAFEQSTASRWPLNIGQVYTTLARLERDGLVASLPEEEGGQRPYQLTDAGRAKVSRWFATPVAPDQRPRDELAVKLALAITTPGVDVHAVVQAQRTATMRTLQEYTRLKAQPEDGDELAWRLVLDAATFQAEAELRWLDHCEASLTRYRDLVPAPTETLAPPEATPAEATLPETAPPEHDPQSTDPSTIQNTTQSAEEAPQT